MENNLQIYNTLSRKKELFTPINPGHVGLYVCGPTVYGDAHLGHSRPAITFDILFRFLKHSGYKVRYVRNITDVGHLVNDADEGEDKIAKKARLEKLEPMEIAQYYTDRYHKNMDDLNVLKPSIEPKASGHILEQIDYIKKIPSHYKYIVNGSVYFDVAKFDRKYGYGKLSGRNLLDIKTNTRELEGQGEKKNSFDFALWKKASPEHIMRWPSKWSDGFPGWHLECSVMSQKYLGAEFDIHGGGMDLKFPHHECEIAQSTATTLGKESVKYWMHNNMITINGQKMGKSLGNFITLDQLFGGDNDVLEQAYSPMTIRFFILQAHYRSPLDFSNDALKAAEKGFNRLMAAVATLDKIKAGAESTVNVEDIKTKAYSALNDDINTPILIAHLFDGVKMINSLAAGKEQITAEQLESLKKLYQDLVYDVLGLKNEKEADGGTNEILDKLISLLLTTRNEAKQNKDWATADKIRDELNSYGIAIKDTKDGSEWEIIQ